MVVLDRFIMVMTIKFNVADPFQNVLRLRISQAQESEVAIPLKLINISVLCATTCTL